MSQGLTQDNATEILDSNDFKIHFKFVDSSHAIFILDEFEYQRVRLVNYSIKGDTLLLSENKEKLSISTAIFYDFNDTLDESMIMLQSLYKHQFEDGYGLPKGVVFKTPCGKTSSIDTTDYKSTSILNCSMRRFPLVIQKQYGKDVELEIDLPENTNHVMIKFVDLFTIEFPYWLLLPALPIERTINGNEYILVWE
ncbi:MAG: hypothetical protein COA32_02280 [Fluviicola sp.]|nr:MAG: hypothetical protein COA32_02280 [Fluviicola sp.]